MAPAKIISSTNTTPGKLTPVIENHLLRLSISFYDHHVTMTKLTDQKVQYNDRIKKFKDFAVTSFIFIRNFDHKNFFLKIT